jgi:iron(III) transport system substrate-binding protein
VPSVPRLGALSLLVLALATACAGSDRSRSGEGGTLMVYSGREEELVEPLFDAFERASGISVEVRYGDSAELAATIADEGDDSPAEIFFAQDAGTLGPVADEGLLAELPAEVLERVDERFRDPDGRWVGTSGRARVVAYNTDAVAEDELPDTIFGFTGPRWKGKLGLPPANASFQAFVTAMRLTVGEERTRVWLEAIKDSEPRFYERNGAVLEALAAGEIDVGLVDHSHLYLLKDEQPDARVANHYLGGGDAGALVNVAGVGIVEHADADAPRRFVRFLLADEAQRFYAELAREAEYPLVAGIEARPGLPALDEIDGPAIAFEDLGAELEETLELLNELGYTS